MRIKEMNEAYPFPWRHETDGKLMSAVVAANGRVVCGSLICQQPRQTATADRQAHAFITARASIKKLCS